MYASVCLSLCFFFSVSLCFFHFVSFCVSLCFCLCISLSISFAIYISLSLPLPLPSISDYPTDEAFASYCLSLFLSLTSIFSCLFLFFARTLEHCRYILSPCRCMRSYGDNGVNSGKTEAFVCCCISCLLLLVACADVFFWLDCICLVFSRHAFLALFVFCLF